MCPFSVYSRSYSSKCFQDERKQLSAKIEKLTKQTAGEPGFEALLEVTSSLRQQQDEDNRLNENQRKQLMTLQHVRQRHEENSRRLQQLKRSQQANSSAEDMLRQLADEVKELQHRVNVVMPREVEQETVKLQRLQEQMYEPHRSKEDVDQMENQLSTLEENCRKLKQQIDDEVGNRHDNKLAMFRQTAHVAAKKLSAKEDDAEQLEQNLNRLREEVEEKEMRISEVSGPKHMTRDEFKKYGGALREKTHTMKKMKQELAELRNELVLLGRTETILRGRDKNLDDFLSKLEMQKGIVGYRETQQKLERASEITSSVDANKEQTLEEISSIVQEISNKLKEQKTALAPQIKRLREVRKEYTDVETEYNRKKQMYDKIAVGLEVERQQIEQEADSLQSDCLREESNLHYYQNLTSISQASLDRVRNEEKWMRGEGHLLPNFSTYAALYKDKEARQKNLKEQLQRQKVFLLANSFHKLFSLFLIFVAYLLFMSFIHRRMSRTMSLRTRISAGSLVSSISCYQRNLRRRRNAKVNNLILVLHHRNSMWVLQRSCDWTCRDRPDWQSPARYRKIFWWVGPIAFFRWVTWK